MKDRGGARIGAGPPCSTSACMTEYSHELDQIVHARGKCKGHSSPKHPPQALSSRLKRYHACYHVCHRVVLIQVGVFRRGKYAGGKKVGKGNVANVGDTVKKGQTLGYVEQLGTFVEVKVRG